MTNAKTQSLENPNQPMSTAFRQSSWIVTLTLAASAVAYVAMLWLPNHRAIKEMRAQVEAKRSLVAQATELSSELIRVQRELDQSEGVVTRWQKMAPKKRDIPALYGKIDALAKDAQLAISRFDPQPFVVHEKLQEIPIAMTCSGTFAQTYQFLQAIEGMRVAVWVESMKLDKMAQTEKHIQCELNLVVFSNNLQIPDYTRHTD